MKKKIFSSIKTRLSLWFVATLALITISFSIALYISLGKSLTNRIDASLESTALKRKGDITEGLEEFNGTLPEEDLEDIENLDDEINVFTLIYGQLSKLTFEPGATRPRIEMLAKSRTLGKFTIPFPRYRNKEDVVPRLMNYTEPRLTAIPLRRLDFPISAGNGTYYILQYATSRKEAEETIGTLLVLMLVFVPILLAVSFFGGYWLVNKTLKPVKTVVASARAITADDLSHRIPGTGSQDEIGELVFTINDMIARLDRSFRKIKQFSTDVSHEFKSPLTVIRGEIDVTLRKKRFKKDYELTLQSIREEVVSLQRVVDNLLFLGSTEAEGQDLKFKPIVLDKILLSVFEEIQFQAQSNGIRFVLKEVQAVKVKAEPTLLARVFFNLLENAVKYTGQSGKVEILLRQQEGNAVFSISDTGPGIPAQDLPHIFERFYRVDKARSRRMGSAGLGLSIVSQIVQLHKGEIEAVSTPGEGSRFTLRLPALAVPSPPED